MNAAPAPRCCAYHQSGGYPRCECNLNTLEELGGQAPTADVAVERAELAAKLLRLAQSAPYTVHRTIEHMIGQLVWGRDPLQLAREASQHARHALAEAGDDVSDDHVAATSEQLRDRASFYRALAKTLRGGLASVG